MSRNSWFDRWFETSARSIASRTSRRSFLVKMAGALVGTAALPLLPVLRAGEARADGTKPDWSNPLKCDYWAYCANSGFLCSGCGGASSKCPPGAEPSPISWIGTCRNPGDGKSYVVSYNDCCGKAECGDMEYFCERSEGDTPRYRPQRANAVTWCYGGVSGTYHCTVSRLMSVVES